MENVIQAEFFHLGGSDTGSLEQLVAQVVERVRDALPLLLSGERDGFGIKTCVRFYDTRGALTSLVREHEHLSRTSIGVLGAFGDTRSRVRRKWLGFRWRHLKGRQKRVEQKLQLHVVEALVDALARMVPVGIEVWNHSYRPLGPEEYHEVLEGVRSAKGMWVFVFEPNDLYADSNKLVASAM